MIFSLRVNQYYYYTHQKTRGDRLYRENAISLIALRHVSLLRESENTFPGGNGISDATSPTMFYDHRFGNL